MERGHGRRPGDAGQSKTCSYKMNEFWGHNVQHGEYMVITCCLYMVSLMAQMVKNLPAMWGNWVQSLGWEDPLEKDMATYSSILAWRIPWTEEPSRLKESQRVRHDWVTDMFTVIILIVNKKVFSGLSLACVLPGSEGGFFDSPFLPQGCL